MRFLRGAICIAIVAIMAAFLRFDSAFAAATVVTDFSGFSTAATNGGEIELGNNITMTAHVFVRKPLSIDLKGHTLDTSSLTIIPYSDFIISDSVGGGKIIGTSAYKIQIGNTSGKSGKVILESGTIEATAKQAVNILDGELIVNGGLITSGSYTVYNGAKITINGGEVTTTSNDYFAIYNKGGDLEMNGGKVSTQADNVAINFSYDGDNDKKSTGVINGGIVEATAGTDGTAIAIFKYCELIINGGKIISDWGAVVGNGSTSGGSQGTGAKITITGGELISNGGTALYIPQQDGETNISGGTLTGNYSAVEIRAGTLNITGGTFISSSDSYWVNSNYTGATTAGAAIAIAQHKTVQPINVNIYAGYFKAIVPFSEANPEDNTPEDIAKVVVNINQPSGELVFESTGDKSINAENATSGFVRGGFYTYSVADFLADGYAQRYHEDRGLYEVLPYRTITAAGAAHGSVTASVARAIEGDQIELTVTPDNDYWLESLVVTDSHGTTITVHNRTFIMPNDDVTITAVFATVELPATADDFPTHISAIVIFSGVLLALGCAKRKNLV